MKFSSLLSISSWNTYFKTTRQSLHVFWKKLVRSTSEIIPYASSSKLQGVGYVDMISEWVYFKYPKNHIIILTNVNVEAKNIHFWAKVPKTDTLHFMEDIVILYCKDKSEVLRLIENIPVSFADAMGFSAGIPIAINTEF